MHHASLEALRVARPEAVGLARTKAPGPARRPGGRADRHNHARRLRRLFIAFSTANPQAFDGDRVVNVHMVPNDSVDSLFEAVVEATEEAIINALVAAETLESRAGR
jgi:hypothetical protein